MILSKFKGSAATRSLGQGHLNTEQLRFWSEHDHLVIPEYFTKGEVEKMIQWTEEIKNWPMTTGRHLNYYEKINSELYLSRTENFLPFHPEFRDLIEHSGIFEMIEQLLGEPVMLFKEKINYKYPKTGEYPAHQDIHAHDTSPLAFQAYHRNVAIFLDPATRENGCMELGWGYEKNKVLDHLPTGELLPEETKKLTWRPVLCGPGSLFLFDMYWPHLSKVNSSSSPRRTIFLTFNGLSKGDLREAHLKDRATGKPNTREIKPNLIVQSLLDKKKF